jgi:hypothetical protein
MKTQVNASFAIKGWEENTWDGKPASQVNGEKLTRAQVSCVYEGDIKGESQLQYLMTYRQDGTGSYVGLERIEGSLKGRSGSFVLQHAGTFEAHGVKGTVFVVPGCGSGDLQTLRGAGSIDLAGQQPHYPIALECELE